MKINLKVDKEEDLLEENASYSLGWIEIVDRAKEISLFKDNLCMVFLTTGFLIEHIKQLETKKAIKLEWVGEDYGAVFNLSIINRRLCIEDTSFSIYLNYQDFKTALIESIRDFLKHCLVLNPNIQYESAFIDLQTAVRELE